MRKNIALLLTSSLLGFVVLEIGLRIHYWHRSTGRLEDLRNRPAPPPGTEVKLGDLLCVSPNRNLVYQLKPNLDVLFRGYRVRTNSLGWRDQEPCTHKQPGQVRIVGIGDSIMFGWGVEESLRFMDQFETALGEEYPELEWRTDVLAAPGYNLAMEIEALELFGLDPTPDLIIYNFVANDICLPVFLTREKDVYSFDSFLLYALRKDLRLPVLARRHLALGGVGEELTGIDPEFKTTFCDPAGSPSRFRHMVGEEALREGLEALARIGAQQGIEVVVLSQLPSELARNAMPQSLHYVHAGKQYQQAFAEEGCDNLSDSTLFLSPSDSHPSPAGHRILADRLFDYLHQQGLIERIMLARQQEVE